MFVTTKALVLRETKYKEADKLLTVLTEKEGKLTVKARGAMRKGCKFAAAAQLYTLSEMTLFGNKDRWNINEASVIEQFIGLRRDIEILALAGYFAELIDLVTGEGNPDTEILRLALNSLYALSEDLYPPEHIKAVFELRLMCAAGFEPMLDSCGVCEDEPEDAMLSLNGGILHCRRCNPGSAGISMPVSPDAVAAMRHIESADPKRVFSFTLEGAAQKQLYDVCEAYAAAQLEHTCSALSYYKSVKAR